MCVPSRLRLVLAVVCLILPGISASCGPLPAETVSGANYTSICSLVLGYANNVALSPTATCAALDDNPMSLVASFASALSSPCAYAVVKYTCAILHPPCNQPPPVYLPPSELCTALNVSDPSTVCTGFDPYILPMLQQAMQSNGVTSFSYSLCSPPQFNSTVTFKPPANQTLGYATKQELTLPSCASFTSTTSPCTGVVDYPVYLSASSPYQIPQSEGLVAGFSFLNNLVPASCANNYQKLMCYSTFPRCQNLLELYSAVNPQVAGLVAAGLVVPIASSPTRALCNNVMATCGSDPTGTPWVAPWFYPLGLTAFCDSQRISARGCDGPLPSVLSTTPAFLPPNGTSPAAGVTILPIDMYNNASVSAYISCPSPLVRPDSPNAKTLNGGSCAIPCPTWFFFPDDFWTDKIDPLLLTIGTISIFLHLVSLTLFILNSNRTLLPLINVLMILVAFALWAPAAFRKNHRNDFGKFAGAICDDNSQSSDTYGCLGAAVVLFWSGLAASTMWLIVCVEVMFSAWYPLDVVKQKFQRIKRILVFIAFFWPTVSTIANAAEGQLGSDGGGNPVCFIKDDDLAYYRYFVPTLTISCVGAVFIIIAFFGVHRSATKTSDTHRFMSFYARSVLFVLVFILIQVIWIAYATSERNKTDQYTAQTTEYVTCLLSGRPASILQHAQNPAVPIIDCETYRPQRSPGFFLFVEALLLGYGLWFFPVFVRNGDFGRAWNNLMGIMHPKSETREVPRTASRNSAQSARSARGSSASNLGTWRDNPRTVTAVPENTGVPEDVHMELESQSRMRPMDSHRDHDAPLDSPSY